MNEALNRSQGPGQRLFGDPSLLSPSAFEPQDRALENHSSGTQFSKET